MEYYLECWPIIEIRRSCLLYPSLVSMYAYRIKNWPCFGLRLSLIRFIINWYSENSCKISSYQGSLNRPQTGEREYWALFTQLRQYLCCFSPLWQQPRQEVLQLNTCLLAFCHFSVEKLLLTVSVPARFRHICYLQSIKYEVKIKFEIAW